MKKLLTALLAVLLLASALSVGPVSATEPSLPDLIYLSKEVTSLQEGEDLTVTLSCGIWPDLFDTRIPPESVTARIIMCYLKIEEVDEGSGVIEYQAMAASVRRSHREAVEVEEFVLREIEDFSGCLWPANVYTEKVTVPADRFSFPAGIVCWTLDIEVTYAGDSGLLPQHYEDAVSVYYRKFDGEIRLYDGEYEFRQSYQTGCNQTLFARV